MLAFLRDITLDSRISYINIYEVLLVFLYRNVRKLTSGAEL